MIEHDHAVARRQQVRHLLELGGGIAAATVRERNRKRACIVIHLEMNAAVVAIGKRHGRGFRGRGRLEIFSPLGCHRHDSLAVQADEQHGPPASRRVRLAECCIRQATGPNPEIADCSPQRYLL